MLNRLYVWLLCLSFLIFAGVSGDWLGQTTAPIDHDILVSSGGAWVKKTMPNCPTGAVQYTAATGLFQCGTMSGLPAGLVAFILSGTCPSGYTEVAALNGIAVIGTLAANANVGTTGGSDTITPAGTVAWPAGVPTFAGNALATHTHTFTGNAVNSSATAASPDLVTSNTGGSGVSPTTTATGTNASISAGTPAGTVAWPAGVPTFAGAGGDNRQAFIRAIFCSKD